MLQRCPILSPPAAPMWWGPPYLYPRHFFLESPAGRSLRHAGGPPLVAVGARGGNGGNHVGMANSGNRATPPSKQAVAATAPRPRAARRWKPAGPPSAPAACRHPPSGSRAARALAAASRPRPSPSRAADTSTNSCAVLVSAYMGTPASRSSISATRRGAEAEEAAPLRTLCSEPSPRHAVANATTTTSSPRHLPRMMTSSAPSRAERRQRPVTP
jgi:hypothetical protein